jgi:DNA-binding transcriptional ArsR family regulator
MLNESHLLDRAFHALADSTRRAMVERLTAQPMTVSDLAKPFEMSLPAVMQHLSVLETAGLIRSHKAGRVRTCRIDPVAMRLVEHWMLDRRGEWESRFDKLDDYLKILEGKEK